MCDLHRAVWDDKARGLLGALKSITRSLLLCRQGFPPRGQELRKGWVSVPNAFTYLPWHTPRATRMADTGATADHSGAYARQDPPTMYLKGPARLTIASKWRKALLQLHRADRHHSVVSTSVPPMRRLGQLFHRTVRTVWPPPEEGRGGR